jgi:hypothetical protein
MTAWNMANADSLKKQQSRMATVYGEAQRLMEAEGLLPKIKGKYSPTAQKRINDMRQQILTQADAIGPNVTVSQLNDISRDIVQQTKDEVFA